MGEAGEDIEGGAGIWVGVEAYAALGADAAPVAGEEGATEQVGPDGQAIEAPLVPLGPDAGSWAVRELFQSEIARKIDDVIDWIDPNVKGDPLVRLLIVPAYQLHAFWLKEGEASQVVVVDMPNGFTRLQYGKLYTSKEFLEALAQEQHIIGISTR